LPLERVWVQITSRRTAGGSCTPGNSRAQLEGRIRDREVVSPPKANDLAATAQKSKIVFLSMIGILVVALINCEF
jgi:hypothetical protein